MFKFLSVAALAAVCAVPAAATDFNLVGATGSSTSGYSYTNGGLQLDVTGFTYWVAPSALTGLSQLTGGATVTRTSGVPGGLGVATAGEDGGETPQVDADGLPNNTPGATPNEALRFSLAGGLSASLTSVTLDWVDNDDTLRIYGLKDGALTLLGTSGTLYSSSALTHTLGGSTSGVTVTRGAGALSNSSLFTVDFGNTVGAYSAYYFTSNNDSFDGYQIRSISLAPAVPESATWGMMVIGFGAMGAAMRRPRRSLSLV